MTAAELRERIMAALRARASDASVRVLGYATWGEVELIATGATELDALAALAVAVGLDADGADPRAEIDHLDALLARQRAILTGVANALRGDPGPLASHSHHDLAERAAAMVAEVATLRAAYASDLAGLRAEVRRADDERAAWRGLRDAAREMLTALEAPAPVTVWDADESEHDAHEARLTAAFDAVRAMVAP